MAVSERRMREWKRLADAATPAPWRAPKSGWMPPETMGMRAEYEPEGWMPRHAWDYRVNADARDCEEENGVAYECQQEDAEFIAAAREAVPELIAEVRQLRRLLTTRVGRAMAKKRAAR